MPQTTDFWPYCSQSCAVQMAWGAVEAMEQSVAQLDGPLQELLRLHAILDSCPFEEASGRLQRVIQAVRTTISTAQRELTKATVDFTHDATVFTDALSLLIVDADEETRRANPAWMKHPQTWSAARDPKWLRDAMGGDFIQHWLSYHLYEMSGKVVLVVYRSTWLRTTDAMYKPIADLLAHGYEVLARDVNQDTDMVFGQAELTVYALKAPAIEAIN